MRDNEYISKLTYHRLMTESAGRAIGGKNSGELVERFRSIIERLESAIERDIPFAAVIEELQRWLDSNVNNRARVLHALLPMWFYEHVLLSDLFSPQHYLLEDHYKYYRAYVLHCPFGPLQAELRRLYGLTEVPIETPDCPILDCDIGTDGCALSMIIGLFFRLLSPLGRVEPASVSQIFQFYRDYRQNLAGAVFGDERLAAGLAAKPALNDTPYLDLLCRLARLQCRALVSSLRSDPKTLTRVAAMLESKAAYSIVHHANAYVGPLNIAAEFSREDFDMREFARALKVSSWVDRSNPQASRFFSALTDSGKPMNGVFCEKELDLIRAWIGSADDDEDEHAFERIARQSLQSLMKSEFFSPARVENRSLDRKRPTQKELYFSLLAEQDDCVAPQFVRSLLEDKLAEAEHIEGFPLSHPSYGYFDYDPQSLATRIDAIYQLQCDEWKARLSNSLPPSLDLLKKYIVVYSPVALVDGAWLQGVSKQFHYDRHLTDLLFRIYDEEMGNGDYRANHARIYRDLLASILDDWVAVDRLKSLSDADVPAEAYEMANVSLALGRFSHDFFPELLGWTLASELVGLGGGFQHVAEQLARYGLNPTFYLVHISADNLSSGHSQMAQTAVLRFMDRGQVGRNGAQSPESTWRRVWTGFRMYRLLDGCGPWVKFEVGARLTSE